MKRLNDHDHPSSLKTINTTGNENAGTAGVRGPRPGSPAGVLIPTATRHRVRWRRRLLLVAVVCLALWPFLAWAGAKLIIVKVELPAANAIVVLSGSSTYIERADWAARLYREGRAPLVILTDDKLISGWNRVEERNPYFYELAARELQNRSVPGDRIQVISDAALGTYDESVNVCEYARRQRLGKLLIVTSAYHSRRALWSIRHACPGYEIETGVDSPPPGWQTPSPWSWWLHRWGWRVVAGEYVKMIYYRMRY